MNAVILNEVFTAFAYVGAWLRTTGPCALVTLRLDIVHPEYTNFQDYDFQLLECFE